MSDLPPGATSLEPEEGTTLVGAVTDADSTETDTEPEGTVTTPTGEKMVPLKALTSERGLRKEAQKSLKEVQPKADEYDRVKGQVQAVMPLIERVKARPDVLKMLDQPPQADPTPPGPLSAQEAVEYAKDFDLFTPEGKPDVDRAQRIATRNLQMTARQTAMQMAPIVGNEAQRQSATNFNHFAQMQMADGTTVDQKILAEMWKHVPAEQSANPAVANVLYLTAIGEQVRQGKSPKAGPGPVLITEGMGHSRQPAKTLTDLDTSIMKAAGIAEKTYKDTAERFKPGQPNALE